MEGGRGGGRRGGGREGGQERREGGGGDGEDVIEVMYELASTLATQHQLNWTHTPGLVYIHVHVQAAKHTSGMQ